MSGDESLVLFFCLIVVIWAGGRAWFDHVALARTFGDRALITRPILTALAGATVVIFVVLQLLGSHDVRGDVGYITFYLLMGVATLKLCAVLANLLGVSFRDDCLERGNRAAAYALAGVLLGGGFCYAGSNVGEGPGWWVVVFCAGLAIGGMFICWMVLNAFAPVAEAITVERDLSAALRALGFFAAVGLALGRAVAGDWISAGRTVLDFVVFGWPVLLIVGLAIFFELQHPLTAVRPVGKPFGEGVVPAGCLLLVAMVDLLVLGMPR